MELRGYLLHQEAAEAAELLGCRALQALVEFLKLQGFREHRVRMLNLGHRALVEHRGQTELQHRQMAQVVHQLPLVFLEEMVVVALREHRGLLGE